MRIVSNTSMGRGRTSLGRRMKQTNEMRSLGWCLDANLGLTMYYGYA